MTSGEKRKLPSARELSRAETMKRAIRNAETEDHSLSNADMVLHAMLDTFASSAESAFELGDTTVLIQVLRLYLDNNRLPPKWARDELREACDADVQSWHEVLGEHPGKKSKRQLKEEEAYREGEILRKQLGYKRADDSDLFPELGKILGLSAGMAKEYYYGQSNRSTKWWLKKFSEIDARLPTRRKRGNEEDLLFIRKRRQLELLAVMTENVQNEVKIRLQIADDILQEARSGKPPQQIVEETLQKRKKKCASGKTATKIRINKS
jgi:hypothetical protein